MGSRSPAQPTPESRVGHYNIAATEIGKGSFATVRKGHDARRPRSVVAVKIVSRALLSDKLLANLEGEISILRSISHPNVVELYDCIKTSDHVYLVMAFCPWGDLSTYIKSHGTLPSMPAQPEAADPVYSSADLGASVVANDTLMAAIPDPLAAINAVWDDVKNFPASPGGGLNLWTVRSFLYQLCSALEFMWSKHIVHRDIKPQNLLLQPAGPAFLASGHPIGIPQIKVADFGFARHLPATSLAETLCGSPLYMAPEILRREKYGAKADLWSVGAVTYEMATGKPPFNASNHMELLRRIEKNDDRIRFPDERSDGSIARENARRLQENLPPYERPPAVPDDLKGVIRMLLKRRAVERAGFDELFGLDAVASGSGPQLARALGRPVPSSVPGSGVLSPTDAPSPSTSQRGRESAASQTASFSSEPVSSYKPPPTTPTLPPGTATTVAGPTTAPPASGILSASGYPPARSRAMPIPGNSPCLRPRDCPDTILRSLPVSGMLRRPSRSASCTTSGVFELEAVSPAGPKPSSRPPPARKTTVGFTPLAALSSPRNREASPVAPGPGGKSYSPRDPAPHVSSFETPRGSSNNVTPTATPKQQPSTHASTSSSSGDTSKLLSAAPSRRFPRDASDRSRSSSVSLSVTGPVQGSSGVRLVGDDPLLDGEYAMVDDQPMRAASDIDAFIPGYPGTFSPSSAQAAANAARAAAVAALGASPIRRLSRIRTASLVKLGGAVLGGLPSSRVPPQPHSASPAILPDRAARPSPAGSPVPAFIRTRTVSAAEPTMDTLSASPPRMQSRTQSASQRRMTGDFGGRTSRHASISGPTFPSPAPRTPVPSMSPTSNVAGGARPLPIPHSPALALPPHQRPASFHRRSSTSYSGSGASFSPRYGQALVPAVTSGRTVSPVPSSNSPVASSPVPLRFGSRASSFGQETQARGTPGQRVSPSPYGASLPAPSMLHSPTLDLSSGGLSNGGSASPYRGVPPSPMAGSSLSRALVMATARLQGTPSGSTPLRNAQAIVRGDRRSQSISSTGAFGASSLAMGAGSLEPPAGPSADLDPSERQMLKSLHDLDKKALVLTELGNYLLAPHGTVGTSTFDNDGRGPSPYPAVIGHAHRPSVGSGRSFSSLSFASGTAGERDGGTPGTTPSSTPFNSGSVISAFPNCPPLAPISDAEAVAAECLLIYVRAASLVDRALNEARSLFDGRKASHPSRDACPDLIEKTRSLQRRFREIHDQIDMVRAWLGDADALHPQEDINQLILRMAKQMAKGAALDDWNRNHSHLTPPSSPSISTSASTSNSAGLSLDPRRRPSVEQVEKEWNPQQCILAYEMAETLFLTLLDPGLEDLGPTLSPQEASAVEKYAQSIGKRLASLRGTSDAQAMPQPSS